MTRPKINHDLRCVDGVTLYLPPSPLEELVSLEQPDVYAESETAKYPIGTLAWFQGMGKKYRYCKAGNALTGIKLLAYNGNRPPTAAGYEDVNGFYDGASVATWAIDATEFTFTDVKDRVKDYYAGAHLLHFDGTRAVWFEDGYIISGPPAAITGGGGSCTVQFHKPRKTAKLSGDGIQIWLSPYSNIQEHDTVGNIHWQTAMGVPPMPIQADYYFWLQTAGPVFITPNGWSTLCPGFAVDSRIAMADAGGGSITTEANAPTGSQRVGDLLNVTIAGSADAWVNMDLDLGH